MSAEQFERKKAGRQVGYKLAEVILQETLAREEWTKVRAQRLQILQEIRGTLVYLQARVLDREDLSCRAGQSIEPFQYSKEALPDGWLRPDYYEIGELDLVKPEIPMIFLMGSGPMAGVRYYAYADTLRVLEPPHPRPSA